MADRRKDDISYGNFGQLHYDSNVLGWHSRRDLATRNTLRPLIETRTVFPASIATTDTWNPYISDFPSRRRDKQAQALIRNLPELQPAGDILSEFARVSEAVEDAAKHHDPNKGQLLATAKIPDEAMKAPTTVFAFPSGPSGSQLRLVASRIHRIGWSDTRNAYLKAPMPTGEEATWSGPGVPLQQIVFAQPFERGDSLLAVRLITSTALFKPVLRDLSEARMSRLDSNFILEINMDETGGAPHADVAFNPWYTRQLAIIDQAGRWSVWELEGRIPKYANKVQEGRIAPMENDIESGFLDDAWARIIWVNNPTTIAICARHVFEITSISKKTVLDETHNFAGHSVNLDCIFGITRIQTRTDHLAVLTGTEISVYHVNEDINNQISIKNVFRERHFLNPEDLSLSIYSFNNENETTLLVHSGIAPSSVAFGLSFVGNNIKSWTDAFELIRPSGGEAGFIGLLVALVSVGGRTRDLTCKATEYVNKGVQFLSVTSLTRHLGVTHSLHWTGRHQMPELFVETPSWELERPLTKSTNILPLDPFIVDAKELTDPDDDLFQNMPVSAYVQRRRREASEMALQSRTVDFSGIALQLNEVGVEQVAGLEEVIEEARQFLYANSVDDAKLPLPTLRDLVDGEITVLDEGKASEHMSALRNILHLSREDELRHHPSEVTQHSHLALRPISELQTPDGQLPRRELSAVHADMSATWISPIPDNVSQLAHFAKQQLVKRMAAAVSSASHVLRIEQNIDDQEERAEPEKSTQNQQWELPLRPSDILQGEPLSGPSHPSSSPGPLGDTLPTPSPSATPSAITRSSHPSSFNATEVQALSRFTTFSKPILITLPRSTKRVLAQWIPGTDVASHDWRSITRDIARREDEDEEDRDEMTDHERRSMQRKAERYVRRQRREAEESRRQRLLHSQIPEIITAFQPTETHQIAPSAIGQHPQSTQTDQHLLPSSGQTFGFPSHMPASQVLPGRHGGRPPARKKRKSGF